MIKTISLNTGQTFPLQPGGTDALFYSGSPAEARCIGHMRIDVDTSGKLWTSWWPHQAAQKHNRPPFREEFTAVINALRRDIFAKPDGILQALIDRGVPAIVDNRCYGFHMGGIKEVVAWVGVSVSTITNVLN